MKKGIYCTASILAGNLLVAFAISTLMLDHSIVVGGVSGLGVVAQNYLHIPVSLGAAVANGALFLAGWLVLGRAFALTTLASTFVFPLFLRLFERCPGLNGWMPDPLAASVIAGCLIGLGIGLVIRAGASTGGVDILALILNKKRHIPVHLSLYAIDLTILLLQIPLRDVTQIFYGLVATALSSMVLNKTLSAGSSLSQMVVVSDHYEEIRQAVLHQLDAGAGFWNEDGPSLGSGTLELVVKGGAPKRHGARDILHPPYDGTDGQHSKNLHFLNPDAPGPNQP